MTYEEKQLGYSVAVCLSEIENVSRSMILELSKIFCERKNANPEQVARFVESRVPHTI